MPDDYMTSEQMMKLPLPVAVVDKGTGHILYANEAAQGSGLQPGLRLDETPAKPDMAPGVQERSVNIAVNGRVLRAKISETEIDCGGKPARLIAFSSLRSADEALGDWDVCAVFLKPNRTDSMNEFLSLTGKNAGAFCAALYETRTQRCVLRGEWRSRRSVSVPALQPDFALHIGEESEKIREAKGAADIAVFPYTKSHGTKGYAIYFFDNAIPPERKKRLERFVSFYGAFAFDTPLSSRLVLHYGVNAMEQGVAVWQEGTRTLLFCNHAYRGMFGRSRNGAIDDVLGTDIRGRVTRETIADGRGRYFDVTHTACGNRSRGVISTIIVDNTAYVKAQRRLDAMARTDALTGLYNRRAGLEYLEQSYEQCRQQRRPLTVCFADIDGLKRVNDTWGHGAGDALIQSAAALIKKYTDGNGEVCRLGGDEFVLILPGQMAAQAELIAAQIGREAAQSFAGKAGGITISFGFKQAEFITGETADTLISVADMEMYRKKNSKSR